MSHNNHSHLRATDGQSTLSTRSDYGSGVTDQQATDSYNSSNGGYAAPVPAHSASLGVGQPRVALPACVRYPPSMLTGYQPRQHAPIPNSHIVNYSPPHLRATIGHPPPHPSSVAVGIAQATPTIPVASSESTAGVAYDVIRQLDVAADENNRLRSRLQENNRILEVKVEAIQQCLDSRNREKHELEARITHLEEKLREEAAQRQTERVQWEVTQRRSMPAKMPDNTVDETTNKLFEAQVAVMGFKCRVMQLQGELDDLRKEGREDAAARDQIEMLTAENETLREDLVRARDAARQQPSQQANSRTEQALMLKVQELTNQGKSQDLVIREVNQQLSDKRALFASETQRMHQQSQQLQAEAQRLQTELSRVQNQLATQRQAGDQQLTSLTTQLNMARQEQARVQELGKQLTVTHAEISRLNSDLSQAQKEVEKYKKKAEAFEARLKDSTSKMMSMQDQAKGTQMTTGPVPKPRGDLTQLKTEREQLEMQLATVRSNLDRESRARQGVEAELQEERRKMQAVLMKNSQLLSQLGRGGEGGGGEVEKQRLEHSASEHKQREVEVQQVQLEVERLRREKSQNEETVAVLEKEHKEAIDAKIETDSKLAAVNEELITLRSTSGKQSGKPMNKTVEVRLNEYAGKLTSLEGRYEQAKTDKAKLQDKLEQEKRRMEELEQRTLVLLREKGHLEEDTVRSLQQQKSEADHRFHEKEREMVDMTVRHQEEVDRLRAEMSAQKQNYERKIQEKESTLRSKDKDLETVQQSLQVQQEKEGEMKVLKMNLHHANTELQQKNNEIARVRSELHSHATRLHELHTDAETLRANESQISNHLRETVHENERLKKELTNTQKVTGEFRKECESLVADYQGAAKKIEQLEEERDRYRDQTNMGMRELAQRAERVKSLEGERQSLQDQLMHMDMQLKQYMADFRSEREMRESAFQVKEMAERKQHELSTEVSTLQRQLTEIQTVKHIDSDDHSTGVGGGMGGSPRPDQWTGSSVGSGQHVPPVPRQTNERPVFPTTGEPTGGAPPLPPKPVPMHGEYTPRPGHLQQQPQQQYVGPGAGSGHGVMGAGGGGGGGGGVEYGHHPRQELVTPGPQLNQVRPSVSQGQPAAMAGMTAGPHNIPMVPHQRSGGPQYPPRTEVMPMDPHTRVGGIAMDPHTRVGGVPMDPHTRIAGGPGDVRVAGGAGVPMDPHTRAGGIDPRVGGGHIVPDTHGRPGGPGPGPHSPRQVPISAPGPPPPRPIRAADQGGGNWVAPGDIVNRNRPEEACPLCGRNDFPTVTDLEIHCARCTGP